MHPTESEDIHEPEAQAPDAASPEATEDQASPPWWERMTNRLFHREESEPEPEESDPANAQSERRMVDQAELDRLVQSEADRREAARNKANRDAERKRLRDEDPWALAEMERQEETRQTQETQLHEMVSGIAQIHDSVTLIPLLDILEPAEKERLMKLPGAGEGVDGRKLLTAEALKSLEKHWKAEGAKEAEATLRRNPVFRKQVMSEFSGEVSSPELLPSGSARRTNGRSSHVVNDMLRQQVNLPTSRE